MIGDGLLGDSVSLLNLVSSAAPLVLAQMFLDYCAVAIIPCCGQ